MSVILRSNEPILMKFFGVAESGPENNRLDFGGDPDFLSPILPQFFTPVIHLQWDSVLLGSCLDWTAGRGLVKCYIIWCWGRQFCYITLNGVEVVKNGHF